MAYAPDTHNKAGLFQSESSMADCERLFERVTELQSQRPPSYHHGNAVPQLLSAPTADDGNVGGTNRTFASADIFIV
ncbi:hypothetical protein STEG23_010963 [Scotinomys teguina]